MNTQEKRRRTNNVVIKGLEIGEKNPKQEKQFINKELQLEVIL